MSQSVLEAANVTLTHASGVSYQLQAVAQADGSTLLVKNEAQPVGRLGGTFPNDMQVTVYVGKGGYCVLLNTQADLYYFVLPGGSAKAPDGSWSVALEEPETQIAPPSFVPAPTEPHGQSVTRQAMILGAGIGSRILPLTESFTRIAKPALPLDGDHTVIGRLVHQLAQYDIEQLFVNTYYHRPSVQAALRQACKEANVQLTEIPEARPTGTLGGLHAILKNPDLAPEFCTTEPLLILQGDAVATANFADFLVAHERMEAPITIGCQMVPDEDVDKFGIVVTPKAGQEDPSDYVTGFLEKPSLAEAGPNRFASNGYYILGPECYDWILELYEQRLAQEQEEARQQGKPVPTEVADFDFAYDLFPMVMERGKKLGVNGLYAHRTDGFWCDIGNPLHYYSTLRSLYTGCLGCDLPKNIEDYYSPNGIIYWPRAKAKAANDGFTLDGRVLVGCAFPE